MKKILKLTLALVFIMGATSASAQKFGRVDLAAIVPNMPEYKTALANLEAYGKDLQEQIEAIQVEFNTKYLEYEKNVSTYSDTTRQMKERELQEMQQRIIDFQQIAQQDMQQKEAEELTPIYTKASEAVNKVASAGGYLAIFNTANNEPASAGLAYFDSTSLTDITADVKRELGIVDAE